MIRVCTTKGNFFVKNSPGSRNDSAFSEAIARMSSEYCAMFVHVDKGNLAMVKLDYGKSVAMLDRVVKAEVSYTLALVQRRTIGKLDDLVEAGFIDACLEALVEHFDEFVKHPER